MLSTLAFSIYGEAKNVIVVKKIHVLIHQSIHEVQPAL